LLNKQFYQELSYWYFWALRHVEFPDDTEKDREVRNATSVIRLITRFMFVWFLVEKKLVPEALFDKDELDEHLNYKDCHDSTYYKAILQNLFFATLNTKMKKDYPESRKFVNRQYGIQEFYRYERFFKNKQKALKLFETIPFLNGGLFENLDKNIGHSDEIRIDCFSNRPVHEKRLKVPDFLFFGAEDQIDLSDIYGSKKRKNETVRGIIHILNSYKFTIAENTPIEEEIALDPELLGKVFENLLASYNPETQTTARKQTGSFYTPREIVNYMVDESLIAYLEGKLIESYQKKSGLIPKTPPSQKIMFGKQKPTQTIIAPSDPKIPAGVTKEINDKFRHLLSYTTEDHLFSENDVKVIIAALDNAKILDPACGSGAFPMGILHKMVHILSKLDPQNKQWKQRQIENQTRQIKQDISYAEKIKDNKARQKALDELKERLATINDAFDTNELDFGRKLYLIENCIFGVDIQPIAVQIAKLRFFISLVVDQIVDENKDNLGIIPLPNLETKFVAANTLIGIDKKGQLELNFQNLEINIKEKELAKVRERHFSARTPDTKEKYRLKDEILRNEIAALLEKDGFASEVTQKLAHWNPYDQNTSSDFFDMEWMFGVKDGFDIVIGNPPYGFHKIHTVEAKLYFKEHFVSSKGSFEHYFLFYECSLKLLRGSGILSFIAPVTWITIPSAFSLRKFILSNFYIYEICWLSEEVFDQASVNTLISLIKALPVEEVNIKIFNSINTFPEQPKEERTTNRLHFINNEHVISIFETQKDFEILQKISKLSKPLSQFARPCSGYNPYEVGKGQNPNGLPHSNETIRTKPYHSDIKKSDDWKPEIIGRNLERYHINYSRTRWIKYGPWLAAPRDPENFVGKRILVQEITGGKEKRIVAAYTEKELYHSRDVIPIKIQLQFPDPLYILGLINSVLISWYHHKKNPKAQKGLFPKVLVSDLKKIPIRNIVKRNTYPDRICHDEITALVDKIMNSKKEDHLSDTTALEAEIDGRVAHLYSLTEEEYSLVLKETNCPDPFRVAALNVYRDIARKK
jgi:hypothetical protein